MDAKVYLPDQLHNDEVRSAARATRGHDVDNACAQALMRVRNRLVWDDMRALDDVFKSMDANWDGTLPARRGAPV